jgi:thiosulfate/3-mercaptopyruvate sulfurtransferase
MSGYANPDVLVSTDWVAQHLNDPNIRLVESNEDVLLYDTGHIPGAVNIDWHADLNDPVQRDYINPEEFAKVLSRNGISPDTTVVFYGDKNNWWATYAFWVFQLFGHSNAKIMNGGRMKWLAEGRELSKDRPSYPASNYPVPQRDDSKIRAFRDDVLKHQAPWARAANPDGTFKSADELRAIYEGEQGLKSSDDIIAYCRIGERSSHSWFVLTHLLGYPNVRNYDGSWTEWGNSVRVPIEK